MDQTAQELIKELKEMFEKMADDIRNYGDGCGCCQSTTVGQEPTFKALQEKFDAL